MVADGGRDIGRAIAQAFVSEGADAAVVPPPSLKWRSGVIIDLASRNVGLVASSVVQSSRCS